MNKHNRLPVPPQWRRVRGRQISGVLFEIDTVRGMLRFRRGQYVETVDLTKFGLRPLTETTQEQNNEPDT